VLLSLLAGCGVFAPKSPPLWLCVRQAVLWGAAIALDLLSLKCAGPCVVTRATGELGVGIGLGSVRLGTYIGPKSPDFLRSHGSASRNQQHKCFASAPWCRPSPPPAT
jgi:hypothetical protein